MSIATIQDLKVNPDQKLTPMVTKNLVQVIEQEFERQATLYNAEAEFKREKILDEYRKVCGYETLKKQHEKAKSDVAKAQEIVGEVEKKLHLKGLDVDGSRYNVPHNGGYFYAGDERVAYDSFEQRQLKLAEKKIDKLLETVEANGPENMRNKIIARLWMSGTVGEAMVILREVLGNGVIPSLEVKQLAKLEE